MLASIHPLGERARKRRWGVTVAAYTAASTGAAAAFGAVSGALGGVLPLPEPGSGALAVIVVTLCAVALAFDLRLGGLTLPTVHRQVDKDWLDRYRGWVVGAGFGLQLGLGVLTVVNTSAVYLTFTLAFVSGSWRTGVLLGATFGLVRGLVILGVAKVRRPEQLRAVLRRMQAWRPLSERAGVAVEALTMVAVGAAAIAH